jgi:archaemetzincin
MIGIQYIPGKSAWRSTAGVFALNEKVLWLNNIFGGPVLQLTLIPFKDTDRQEINSLIEDLGVLGLDIAPAKQAEIPQWVYDPKRKQYRAVDLLQLVEHYNGDRILGVTNFDIFLQPLNFVFGLAQAPGRVAVISLFRLRCNGDEDGDSSILRDRALKEAVHELGHTWGLPHCPNPQCVMHFSNSLQDTDLKSKTYCVACYSRLPPLVAAQMKLN